MLRNIVLRNRLQHEFALLVILVVARQAVLVNQGRNGRVSAAA